MEDMEIVALYWQRDEAAIRESAAKYGSYCSTIARSILHSPQDTEECVNDTWLRAWNAMPPDRPSRLAAFLGRITRNLAIDRWRRNRRQNGGQLPLCLEELAGCIGEDSAVEDRVALRELLDTFLRSLSAQQRRIFLLRYWYILPVSEIAARCGMGESAVKMTLQRTRNKLRHYLEQEG